MRFAPRSFRCSSRWLLGLVGLVVLLLARAGHATLIHVHGHEGAHVHLLTLAEASPDGLAAWHARHANEHADEHLPLSGRGDAEHVHGLNEHGAGLLLPPLFVLIPASGARGPLAPLVLAWGFLPEPVRLRVFLRSARAARERDPPRTRAHSGLAAVLLRNHSIRI